MTPDQSLVGDLAVEYVEEETGVRRRVGYEHLEGERWLRVEQRKTTTGWDGVGQQVVHLLSTSPVDERPD